MPEAPMHQDDRAVPGEDDVRAAGEPTNVQAEAEAVAVERGTDQALGRRVMAADGGHDAGAGGLQQQSAHCKSIEPFRIALICQTTVEQGQSKVSDGT